MRTPDWSAHPGLALPVRGSGASAAWDSRVTTALAMTGGLLLLAMSPLVPAAGQMRLAGIGALVVAGWATLTPPTAPAWVRSAYTLLASADIVVGTVAAEHGTSLRLGPVGLLLPLLTVACLRFPVEVAAQTLWALALYGGSLFLALPAGPAAVGLLSSSVIIFMIVFVTCGLRGRLDATVDDLRRQAGTDALTGLHNRAGLRDALARLEPVEGALLLVDLDHFKRVNDEYGHHTGDEVLVWFARLLSVHAGPVDLVARHGGEEFVLYLPGPSPRDAVCEQAEELRARMERTSRARGLPLTISIGVAFGSRHDLPGLLRAADRELYAAKHAGRNVVRVA